MKCVKFGLSSSKLEVMGHCIEGFLSLLILSSFLQASAAVATVVKSQHKRNTSQEFKRTESVESASSLQSKKFRRPLIAPKPNYSLNLWSIMKNCIGKELSKIPMPVSYSCFDSVYLLSNRVRVMVFNTTFNNISVMSDFQMDFHSMQSVMYYTIFCI